MRLCVLALLFPFLAGHYAAAEDSSKCSGNYSGIARAAAGGGGKKAAEPEYLLGSKKIPVADAEALLAGDKSLAEKYQVSRAEEEEIRFLLSTALPETRKLISGVKKFLEPVMDVPEGIEIHLSASENDPTADLTRNILKIGYQYQIKNPMTGKVELKSPELTRVINAHELSHLTLEANLRKNLPFLGEMRETARAERARRLQEIATQISPQENRITALEEEIARLEVNLDPAGDPKYYALDQKRIAEARAEVKKIQEGMIPVLEEISRISVGFFQPADFFSPYHELFSDLVPVAYTNNPSAVYDALKIIESGSSPTTELRNFRSMKTATQGPAFDSGFVHDALKTVRTHLGEEILPQARTLEARQKLVQSVFRSIVEEAKEAHDTGNYMMPTAEANRRLIERIDRHWSRSNSKR